MVTMEMIRRPSAERRTLTEPALGLTAALLDLKLGPVHLDVRSADLGRELLDCTGHRPVLAVDRRARVVRIREARSWLGPPHPPDLDVVLNDRIDWTLHARANGLSGWLDLRRLRLGELDLSASGARFRADLPHPTGPVHVRINGRGVDATLSVPDGVVVRFWSEGGWQVEGGQRPARLPNDRYDVWLHGAGHCRVETRRTELRVLA
jgi:hypothetical protein